MKALVISDKQEIIDSLSQYLVSNNYDLIVYRWLLKALDNIEEIHPDLIFLSASEYPRHWKTLASFVQSGIGGNEVKLYLYDPEPLSDEDKKKAEELGITAFIDSLSPDQLNKILPNEKIEVAVKRNAVKYEVAITDPVSGKIVFGSAVSSDEEFFECNFHIELKDLKLNEYIQYVTVCNKENYVKSFDGNIVEINSEKIVIKVKDYYEEEV